jgi:hypothetical protein
MASVRPENSMEADFARYFLKATSRLFGKACLIPIDNHRWYIFLDIQLRFSYIQLTQKRVPIKKYVLKGGYQDAGISN